MTERAIDRIERELLAELDQMATCIMNVCFPVDLAECPEGCDVRLQVEMDGEELMQWEMHGGLADYDNDHSEHWGASVVMGAETRKELREVARDLISQAMDDLAECAGTFEDFPGEV